MGWCGIAETQQTAYPNSATDVRDAADCGTYATAETPGMTIDKLGE
jgi:hypothetical protein